VAGAARRDHDGYSDAPGRPVLPDGGALPRLAHAEKNSETACSRVADESVRKKSDFFQQLYTSQGC